MSFSIRSISKFFSYFKQAVRGDYQEFTTGSLNKAIFMLSIPMILEMVMESLFAVVDIFFVGKVSVNAVATVALTESVIMIVYSIGIGASMAATAMVARRVGEGNRESASAAAKQAIIVVSLLSILFSVVGIFFAEEVLYLMGGEPDLIREGNGYTRIMLGGNITIMLIFLINAIFRGAGDASIAMRVLWLSNGLNIILDPLLIFGTESIFGFELIPAYGVEGAAIATTTGRGIGVLYQLYKLSGTDSVTRVRWNNLKLDWSIIKQFVKISLGGIGQYLIGTMSWIFMIRISAIFGSEVLAGYAIAFRIIMFTILPSWGMSNAAATLVGQNLGAKKPDRAESSVWKCAFYNMIFLGVISLVFGIWAETVVGIFNSEPEVVKYGAIALRFICIGYVFFAYAMVIGQAFNGAGDTKTPTVINFFVSWLFEAPFAYFLGITMGFGPKGIFSAIAVTLVIWAIVSI
ncbi:MAG: MATE family efflux transporter, partial [Bacteroidota bacterium]